MCSCKTSKLYIERGFETTLDSGSTLCTGIPLFHNGKTLWWCTFEKEVQEYTGNNVEELKVPRNTEEEVWNFIVKSVI